MIDQRFHSNSSLELEVNNVLATLEIALKREMKSDLKGSGNSFFKFLRARGSHLLTEAQLKQAEQSFRSHYDKPDLVTNLLNQENQVK